jgi:hypothetical protein
MKFFRFEKYTDSDGRPRYAIAGYTSVFQVRFLNIVNAFGRCDIKTLDCQLGLNKIVILSNLLCSVTKGLNKIQ